MTVMTSWDLFEDLRSAQDELLQANRMYGQRLLPPGHFGRFGERLETRPSTQAWAPAVDISERPDAYLVTVELPGVGIEKLEITFEDGLLTIRASGTSRTTLLERRSTGSSAVMAPSAGRSPCPAM